jgi:formylglycine-generating enzyme required for sulfatase activity
LRERTTGIIFNLIPGGTFAMGFSELEEQELRGIAAQGFASGNASDVESIDGFINKVRKTCRPVRQVSVAPFLLASFPLQWSQVELYISPDEDNSLYGEYLQGEQFANVDVAYLGEKELEKYLQVSGHMLPSEAQWEYACRAGSGSLFFWGNNLSDMCVWAENFEDAAANNAASNRFGLVNMGFHGDVCADAWHDTYEGASVDSASWIDENGLQERVVRGGGAYTYPWQGCGEWLATIAAFRFQSSISELGVNVRLVRPLPVL